MSYSVRPHRRQPTRLPRPWDSPGKNIGVGCHFLLQCMKGKSESEVSQSCPTLSDPMDCSLPGPSIYGIFQTRVTEWVAIAFPRYNVNAIVNSCKYNVNAVEGSYANRYTTSTSVNATYKSLLERRKFKVCFLKHSRI